MSSPRYYDDGNFRLPVQSGTITFAHPFADKGDSVTFTATRTMRQDARYYQIIQLMATLYFPMGKAYRVNVSEATDVGCGILEWQETFSSLPQTRRIPGSISYTQQFLAQSQDDSGNTIFTLLEWTNTRDAYTVYEYSLNEPLARKLSPKVIQLNNGVKVQTYIEGGFGTFSEGTPILAKDTTSEIWMGRIYCRESTFIIYHQFVQLQ